MRHRIENKQDDSLEHLNQASMDLMKTYFNACEVISNHNRVPHANWQDIFNVEYIYQKWFSELTRDPSKIFQAQTAFFTDYFKLCTHVQNMMLGKKQEPLITPEKTDKRFRASDWKEKPYYYYLHQSYLLFAHHCLQFVEQNASHDPKISRQITFFTRQYLDALSPSNFMQTNPEVIKKTIESKGENLTMGFKNFLDDIVKGDGHWSIKMTDASAFEVGKNIAITPGKVVFQNKMMQLIQYAPTSQKVYQKPLLIIPPWINKFYILDITEDHSFVKWILEQGFTVFMISWVNPDSSYRDISFEDYLESGILAALDAIELSTGEKSVNALGFCIGGTLLATALAYMKAKNDHRIESATYLTSLIDFTDPGEIEVFIDDQQVSSIESKMESDGYLDGRALMATFNMLRANDLFWSYYINNYLCGQTPHAFDLLYWNSDSSNLPMKMVSFLLRSLYLDNLLASNGLTVKNVKLDLNSVTTPSYFLSTELDHIAPWQSTYLGTQLLKGPVTFVLAGSGHIAGVINPPSSHKYGYRHTELDAKAYPDSETWFENSYQEEGSWWEHWINWLKPHGGTKVNPRIPGEGKLPIIQDAPGDYVKKKLH